MECDIIFILIGVLFITAVVDIVSFRIPNMCIAVGMFGGMIYKIFENGLWGMGEGLLHAGIIFLFLYPFFMIQGLGAGDIKLLMMTGMYLTREEIVRSIVVTVLLAGMIAVAKLIRYQESRERFFYLGRYLRKAILTGTWDSYEVNKMEKRSVIRLAVPILCSVLFLYGGY